MPAHSLLFSKSTKGATSFNVPFRRTNRYQQYYMPSQHTYCNSTICLLNIHTAEGFGIQSRPVIYNLVIRKCISPPPPSPEVENFQMKIYYPAGDRTTYPLNQRWTCYHLSQHVEPLPQKSSLHSKEPGLSL